MENILFILVIILAVILIIMLGVMIYLISKYLKVKEVQSSTPDKLSKDLEARMPQNVREQVNKARATKENMLGKFCVDHEDLEAKGRCSISDELYCELCITKENDVRIARKYLHLFLDSQWENTFILNNEDIGADKLNELMRVKREVWTGKSIPIITQKQFKINIENDQIETFTVVMSREQDSELVEKRLGFLKDNEEEVNL